MVHIMCTILVVHIVVIAITVIVALTKNKVQVKYYIMLSKKGKKGLQYLSFYYNLSKRRKKNYIAL